MAVTDVEAPAKPARWTAQWKELYDEVIQTGLCTGCAGCVISCPHDVIGYTHAPGAYKPFHLEDELGPGNCIHGEKGCTTCTRACPRFRSWEPQADEHLFARTRQQDEVSGIYQDILLTRASDDMVHRMGQDGGLVSALLIWAMENDYIDGALTSFLEGEAGEWKARPGVAANKDEVLASAGSRYTYSANTLAINEARERGLSRLALVGMSCQSSVPPIMWTRKVGKVARPILFNIGLLCSKTFDDSIFEELFETKYGLPKQDIVKMNIKGVFQLWTKDGGYHEVPLKECHAWTRDGCTHCPDFAAEHADISTGGIGKDNDWTLTIVRTDLGREIITRMIDDGSIIARPGDEDPGAIALMHKLATKTRGRPPSRPRTARSRTDLTVGQAPTLANSPLAGLGHAVRHDGEDLGRDRGVRVAGGLRRVLHELVERHLLGDAVVGALADVLAGARVDAGGGTRAAVDKLLAQRLAVVARVAAGRVGGRRAGGRLGRVGPAVGLGAGLVVATPAADGGDGDEDDGDHRHDPHDDPQRAVVAAAPATAGGREATGGAAGRPRAEPTEVGVAAGPAGHGPDAGRAAAVARPVGRGGRLGAVARAAGGAGLERGRRRPLAAGRGRRRGRSGGLLDRGRRGRGRPGGRRRATGAAGRTRRAGRRGRGGAG